jgi:hypothetical protein
VVYPPNGRTPREYAYELALLYATRSAKPLTNAEKGAAIARLLAECPELSDRAIARLVGVSHRTVGARRAGVGKLPAEDGSSHEPSSGRREPLRWEVAAKRLARDVDELLASCRKLFGGADYKSAGRELYDALDELYGGEDVLAIVDQLSAVVGNACAHARKAAP